MRCLLAISLEVKALPEHRPLGSGTFIDNIVYAVACGDVCWELAACQAGIVGGQIRLQKQGTSAHQIVTQTRRLWR